VLIVEDGDEVLLWCVEKNVSSSLCVVLYLYAVVVYLYDAVVYCVFHGTLWCTVIVCNVC
jgi:hypothetical protein